MVPLKGYRTCTADRLVNEEILAAMRAGHFSAMMLPANQLEILRSVVVPHSVEV